MRDLAPNITRQRLLIEGFYNVKVNENVIKDFYKKLTQYLELKTYAEPVIHNATGKGKEINSGYDAFIPLVDSGIYLGVWTSEKFLSMIIYTCKKFDEGKAIELTKKFWKIDEIESQSF